jgi:hypothetical protein
MIATTTVIRFRSGHTKRVSVVTREDGKSLTFSELLSKREAIRQAANLPDSAWN